MPKATERFTTLVTETHEREARRLFLKAGAIGSIAASPVVLGACASVAEMRSKVTGDVGAVDTYHRRIGDIDVTTLLDGHFSLDQAMLKNVEEDELEQILSSAYLAPDAAIPLGISIQVLRTGSRTLLLGAGAGSEMGASAGRMSTALASLGIAVEDIDDVLLTHMHPDHVGGALAGDVAAFPNAVLHVSEPEAAYWSDQSNAESVPEPQKPTFPLAAKVFAAYADRLNRFGSGHDFGNGITSEPLPGHTPGHTGFRINSADEQLLACGDMAIIAAVQFAHPDVGVVFDSDVGLATATRKRTLEMIAAERILVSGTHLPFPAYGHVVADGSAWRWQPEEWRYG